MPPTPFTKSLLNIINRNKLPGNWVEGDKIPWDDPAFSERMLHEHLTQDHNAASRRTEIIDAHISWLTANIFTDDSMSILDLACGPGLYTSRLAALGHVCTGIDFSPASINYAKHHATENETYIHGDLRTTDFGTGFDAGMLIFGEFNVFQKSEAAHILEKAHHALKPSGILVLEPHTYAAVEALGNRPARWYSSSYGLFSEGPHIVLMEYFWDSEAHVATIRHYVIDIDSQNTERHTFSVQAYTNDDYAELLETCGFTGIEFHPSLRGNPDEEPEFLVIMANKV